MGRPAAIRAQAPIEPDSTGQGSFPGEPPRRPFHNDALRPKVPCARPSGRHGGSRVQRCSPPARVGPGFHAGASAPRRHQPVTHADLHRYASPAPYPGQRSIAQADAPATRPQGRKLRISGTPPQRMQTVDNQAIARAYDHLAETWLDDRFDPDNGVRSHRQALAFLSANSGGWALNAGCGCNTRFHALFRERGLAIEGVDISGRMVDLARAADPAATIHHADLCTWQAPGRYRFISAWDSIWHVRLEHQRELMLKLLALLEPGGVLILSAGGLDAPSEHIDATMGPALHYATLGIPGLLQVVTDADCVLRHLEFDQLPQLHIVLIAQRPA